MVFTLNVLFYNFSSVLFIKFQNHSQRFELSSAAWKPNQSRVFETIGNFTGGEWQLTQPVFPNEQYGFNGRHFTVVTNLVSCRWKSVNEGL